MVDDHAPLQSEQGQEMHGHKTWPQPPAPAPQPQTAKPLFQP
jgi:hypothetical protein